MKIESKFNIGDTVYSYCNNELLGEIREIIVNESTIIYAILNKGKIKVFEEQYLTLKRVEDLVYYCQLKNLHQADDRKTRTLVIDFTTTKYQFDNIKVTYDSEGNFKTIERI